MHRHDLVTVERKCVFKLHAPHPDRTLANAVADWIEKGRPMVLPRQEPHPHCIQLALRLPPGRGGHRLACTFPRACIRDMGAPLTLRDCLHRFSEPERHILNDLCEDALKSGLDLRVFGSIAWESISGEPYREASSDLDVLADVITSRQLNETLCALEKASSKLPFTLDGEIRFGREWAVSWRELSSLLGKPSAQVLVKGNQSVCLKPVASLLRILS